MNDCCPKCPHQRHQGEICRYPKELFRTAGVPADVCTCSFGMWKGQWMQGDRMARQTAPPYPGARLVNRKHPTGD